MAVAPPLAIAASKAATAGKIASIAGTVGGLASSAFGFKKQSDSQSEINAQNLQIAREQMAFQERMSNTAHQRETKDLEAAGLNRILSLGAGGASSPVGSSATMVNPDQGAAEQSLSSAKTWSLEKQLLNSQVTKNMSDAKLNEASAMSQAENLRTQVSIQQLNSASALREKATAANQLSQAGNAASGSALNKVLTDIKTVEKSRQAMFQPLYESGSSVTNKAQKVYNALDNSTNPLLYDTPLTRTLKKGAKAFVNYTNKKGR